jgi:phosphonate transport system permease protein
VTLAVDKPRTGSLPPPPRTRPSLRWLILTAAVIALLWYSSVKTEISLHSLTSGYHGVIRFLAHAFPPDTDWQGTIKPGLTSALVTLCTGIMGTVLAIPLSLALAIFGSRVTSPSPVIYQLTRTIMSILRAIPDVVFALIFVTAVGLGPFAGVLALICHGSGVMAKLFSEAMDEVDRGPVEALTTTGAKRSQVLQHAVLPTVAPTLVGLVFYRLDTNVRSSLVLGLVGAGGIGFYINQAIELFRFKQMVSFILIVLVVIIAVDQLSSYVRRRLAA